MALTTFRSNRKETICRSGFTKTTFLAGTRSSSKSARLWVSQNLARSLSDLNFGILVITLWINMMPRNVLDVLFAPYEFNQAERHVSIVIQKNTLCNGFPERLIGPCSARRHKTRRDG